MPIPLVRAVLALACAPSGPASPRVGHPIRHRHGRRPDRGRAVRRTSRRRGPWTERVLRSARPDRRPPRAPAAAGHPRRRAAEGAHPGDARRQAHRRVDRRREERGRVHGGRVALGRAGPGAAR